MTECYHKYCDQYNKDVIKEENFDFLAAISQSLMLSVIEMSMEKEESTCISKTVQHIIKKATSNLDYDIKTTKKPPPPPKRSTTTPLVHTPTLTSTTVSSTTTTKLDDSQYEKLIENNLANEENNNLDEIHEIDIKALLRHEILKMMPKLQIPRIDTQINIETLNVDIGTLNMDNTKQCSASSDDGLVLGHENDDVLSNLVKNYYGETDRRKYSGKFKNSPMLIKFVNE